MGFNIAIDGPAGAGKSTIARRAAEKLGFLYVDTGAMYRAIALYLIRQGVRPEDTDAIRRECVGAKVSIAYRDGEQQVLLNGENVNGLIRTEEVAAMSSKASAVPRVRELLLELQQRLAAENDVLMDGRDIGTCVLPEADVKIFLTASVDVRAGRRYEEQKARGGTQTLEEVRSLVIRRDENDRNRIISPLRQAEDAILLDTSDMDIEQVVDRILEICRRKVNG